MNPNVCRIFDGVSGGSIPEVHQSLNERVKGVMPEEWRSETQSDIEETIRMLHHQIQMQQASEPLQRVLAVAG